MTSAYLFCDDGILPDHLAGALSEEVVGFEDDTAGGVPLSPPIQTVSVPPDTVATEYLTGHKQHGHSQTQTSRSQPGTNRHTSPDTAATEYIFGH